MKTRMALWAPLMGRTTVPGWRGCAIVNFRSIESGITRETHKILPLHYGVNNTLVLSV